MKNDLAPDFIEKLCEKMEALPVHPLTEEDVKTYFDITLIPNNRQVDFMHDFMKEDWVMAGLFKRANAALTAIFEPKALAWIRINAKSIGEGVLLLYYAQYKAKKCGNKSIDVPFLSMYVWPMGFPSSEDLQKIWDIQKMNLPGVPTDNAIDIPLASKSIQFD